MKSRPLGRLFSVNNVLDPAYLPILQHHLNAAGMIGLIREQAAHHASGQDTRRLVLLQYNIDRHARLDTVPAAVIVLHKMTSFPLLFYAGGGRIISQESSFCFQILKSEELD
jgi:hypothetical protein